jgi:hypothetical protein
VKALSGIGELSTDEQKRFDVAGDDPERVQQALIDIHQGRITFWREQLDDVQERKRKLQSVIGYSASGLFEGQFQEAAQSIKKDEAEAEKQLNGYTFAYERIQAWRPISFEVYQALKKSQGKPSDADSYGENIQKPTVQQPDYPPIEQKPSAAITAAVNTMPVEIAVPASDSSSIAVNNDVIAALRRYASAMLANNPTLEAASYAPHVEKYYLKANVDNAFVEQDKQEFLDHGNRVTSLRLEDVIVDEQTTATASVRYVRDVTWENSSGSTHKLIRSLIHFQKFDDCWKIVYEQDFR